MQSKLNPKRKTLALALSGCSGRAIAYIGILEVLKENNIPVDMIAACSSATIVAASYACGTLDQLKTRYFNLGRKELMELFEPSLKSGLLSFGKADEAMREYITIDNLEDLPIRVAIVASDLVEGKEIVFSMGDIIRAIKASCSLPGLFEPVVWGNKILVDGGLFSIIPVEAAKKFGADVVIGVDMASTRQLFDAPLVRMRIGYNFITGPFKKVAKLTKQAWDYIFGEQQKSAVAIDDIKSPNLLAVLGSALDYAISERKKGERVNCDLLIEPDVKHFGKYAEESFKTIYEEGRRAAIEALPRIKELMSIPDPVSSRPASRNKAIN